MPLSASTMSYWRIWSVFMKFRNSISKALESSSNFCVPPGVRVMSAIITKRVGPIKYRPSVFYLVLGLGYGTGWNLEPHDHTVGSGISGGHAVV